MELTHTKCGDYYIPDMVIPDTSEHYIVKYGRILKVTYRAISGHLLQYGLTREALAAFGRDQQSLQHMHGYSIVILAKQKDIRNAGFDFPSACIEDVDYRADRALDKPLIMRLGTCNYIRDCRNIILLGATGSGKTWLSNAFGNAACRNFYTVRYVRIPDLLTELSAARAEGTYRKVMKALRQVKLLILDEWLLYPVSDGDVRDILEIIDRRHKTVSTIFCSQYDVGGWHEKLGEPTLTDAICDRVVYDSYTLIIKGKESMRKQEGIKN